VNSIANKTVVNQLELNWAGVSPQEGEWVGLFSSDPNTSGTSDPLERLDFSSSSSPEGFYVTETTVENYATNSSQLGFVARCIGLKQFKLIFLFAMGNTYLYTN